MIWLEDIVHHEGLASASRFLSELTKKNLGHPGLAFITAEEFTEFCATSLTAILKGTHDIVDIDLVLKFKALCQHVPLDAMTFESSLVKVGPCMEAVLWLWVFTQILENSRHLDASLVFRCFEAYIHLFVPQYSPDYEDQAYSAAAAAVNEAMQFLRARDRYQHIFRFYSRLFWEYRHDSILEKTIKTEIGEKRLAKLKEIQTVIDHFSKDAVLLGE